MDKNKRIAVTGGHGFLGKSVVEKLKECGYRNLFLTKSYLFDLRDQNAVIEFFETAKPDAVIHLAGRVGGIAANQARPGEFFFDNASMGLLLMEYGRRFGIEKFLNIGSICSYPSHAQVPFIESELWGGYPEETNASYGLAKKMIVAQGQFYRAQYGMNVISLMPVNLYGPGDAFDEESSHVIPSLIRKFVDAKEQGKSEIVLWGDGTPTREFLYIEDAASGVVEAFQRLEVSDPVNLGSGQEIAIKVLAEKIAVLTGYTGNISWDRSRPNGQLRRRVETTKAKVLFGFESKWSLDEGLRATLNWYVKNRSGQKGELVSQREVSRPGVMV